MARNTTPIYTTKTALIRCDNIVCRRRMKVKNKHERWKMSLTSQLKKLSKVLSWIPPASNSNHFDPDGSIIVMDLPYNDTAELNERMRKLLGISLELYCIRNCKKCWECKKEDLTQDGENRLQIYWFTWDHQSYTGLIRLWFIGTLMSGLAEL